MKNKIVKLKNLYNGDVVLCENYEEETKDSATNISFIRVYDSSNPNRKFLVNKQAYSIVA